MVLDGVAVFRIVWVAVIVMVWVLVFKDIVEVLPSKVVQSP